MKDFVANLKLNTGDFDQNTKKTISELKQLENQGGKALQNLTKSFGPLMGAFTALGTATKIFNELKENSVSFAKEIDNSMFQAETAVNSFFKALGEGDISGFLSNMGEIVKAAKEVYNNKYVRDIFNADKGAFQSELSANLAALDSKRKGLKYELETGLSPLTGEKTGRLKEVIQKDYDEANKQYKIELEKQKKLFEDQQKFSENELNSRFKVIFPNQNITPEQYNQLNRQINTPDFDNSSLGQLYKDYEKANEEIDKKATKTRYRQIGTVAVPEDYIDKDVQKQLRAELDSNNPTLAAVKAIKSLSPEERKVIADLNNDINSAKQGVISTADRAFSDADIQKQFNQKPTTKAPKIETPKVIDARLEQIKVLEQRLEELYIEFKNLDANDIEGQGKLSIEITNIEKTIADLRKTKLTIQELYDISIKLKESGIVLPGLDENIEKLKQLGANVKEVNKVVKENVDKTDYYGNLMNETEKLNSMIKDNLMQSFYQLGSAIGGTFGQVISLMSMSIQTISTVIGIMEQVQAVKAANIALTKSEAVAEGELAVAKAGSAAAGAASSVSMIPFVGPILAVAAIATVMAALIPLLSKHAGGGIIGGSSIVGDKQLVRVNAGEMILNQQQQSNLFAQLHSQELDYTSANFKFRIEGSDLVGVLDNYNKKHR
jgi:hypothetical protein